MSLPEDNNPIQPDSTSTPELSQQDTPKIKARAKTGPISVADIAKDEASNQRLLNDLMTKADPDNLPSVIPAEVLNLLQPIKLEASSSEQDTLAANVEQFNQKLLIVRALAKKVTTFSRALAYLREIDRLIVQRCEIMGHKYGISPRNVTKGNSVLPLD